ncbi:MAG: TonB-dependent receptor [Acidobacteria bacterium]|nr:TonB-dependent receptor [Acidobacteriota bacterium]
MRTNLKTWAICILLFSLPVFGQTFGEITGEVRDPTGAVIGGASITITNVATNATRNATSNDSGVYGFPSLPPGIYNIKVEKAGFKTTTRNQVEIQVQQNARIDFELQVGQVSESIDVSAQAAILSTENSTVGTVVENKRIVELPLNGRNYLQLVALAPNVSYGFPSAGQAGSRQGGQRAAQSIAVAGQRNSFNRFSLDGVENTDPNFNTFVIQPSIDALQEFKVQTGVYPAEFGRGTTQINVLTRSGGNDFHGALFEFLRNDKFDAKNYAFLSARPPKDPFKWNQYGFMVSGPVWIPKIFNGKNRLFFMANYEAFRQRRTVQGVYSLPSAAMRDGNFSELAAGIFDPTTRVRQADGRILAQPFAGGIIPKTRIHPTSIKLLEFYPAPNLPNAQRSSNHQQGLGRPINRDTLVTRMDFVESSKSNWSGRYSWGDENQLDQGLKLNGSAVLTNVEQYMGSNTRVLSPSIVNETRFGYTRFYNSIGRELAFVRNVVEELGIPGLKGGPAVAWGLPSVGLTNYSGFGDDSEGPYENQNRALQFVNNTSWIRGKHTFRWGGEVRNDQYNQVGNQFARGSFGFEINASRNPGANAGGDAFADFLLGQVRRPEAAVSIAAAQFRATGFVLFVDDTWKLTPKVTLALGLRYENTPPWEDQTGTLFTVFIPFMDSTPTVADRSRFPLFLRQGNGDPYQGVSLRWPEIGTIRDGRMGNRLVSRDNNDFAPRLGITWNPTSKWVIRTGAGMFYSQDTGNPRFDMARNLSGRLRDEARDDFPNLTWDNGLASIAGGVANVIRPYSFANKYERRTPYSIQYLLNVQRELPLGTLLEVGYLGSVSRKLENLRAVNEAIPGAVGAVYERSPYFNFGRIQLVDNGGRGHYDSLGLKLTKRYSSGISYLMAYTWSKSIDETSGIRVQNNDTLFPQNSNCMRCERALSAFQTAHRMVTSVLYDIPVGKGKRVNLSSRAADLAIGGWQVGSIVTLQTGFPLNLYSGSDISNTGAGFDRPNATGQNPNLPRGQQDPNRFFNTAAYVVQPRYTFGNVGRNTLIGPGIISWDFSTLKDFRVTESQKLQFRFEAFNFPNHPIWGDPNTTASSPGFGQIRGTRTNMRNLQFALKYVF